jgi:hypothetical protein
MAEADPVAKAKRKRLIIMGVGGLLVAALVGVAAKILLDEDTKPPAKPVAQAPKPAAEAAKPAAEASKAAAQAPKPAAEAPKPAPEAPKPAAVAAAKPAAVAARPGAAKPAVDAAARGKIVIPGTYRWDARTNSIGQGGDLWWQQKSDKERALNPQGRAMLALASGQSFDDMGAAQMVQLAFDSAPIGGNDGMTGLDPGAVLGLRTQDGDYLKLRVVGYYDSHNFSYAGADKLPEKWKELTRAKPKIERFNIELEWVAYPGPAIAAAKGAETRRAAAEKAAPPKAAEPAPVKEAAAEPVAEKAPAAEDDKPKPVAVARPARPEPPSVPGPRYNDVMTAVLYKDSEGLAELLALGRWVDKPDSKGKTALMVAVAENEMAIAEQLLKAGADVSRGMSVAREFRNQPMMALMLKYGAR